MTPGFVYQSLEEAINKNVFARKRARKNQPNKSLDLYNSNPIGVAFKSHDLNPLSDYDGASNHRGAPNDIKSPASRPYSNDSTVNGPPIR